MHRHHPPTIPHPLGLSSSMAGIVAMRAGASKAGCTVFEEIFGHNRSVEILAFPSPTSYMLTSFRFFFSILRHILMIPLKRLVILLKSFFSNSTGSSVVISSWFSSFIVCVYIYLWDKSASQVLWAKKRALWASAISFISSSFESMVL